MLLYQILYKNKEDICYNLIGDNMKKILTLIMILIVITGCNSNIKNEIETTKNEETKKELTIEDIVEEKMSKMTIEEKIAQMLVVYYSKDEVDSTLKNVFTTNTPGGFILMKDNITTYEKTKKFVDNLKNLSDVPLIISIDQEGGNVQRLKAITDKDATNIPYMYNVGLKNDTKLTYKIGKVIAEELRTIGVNVDYAPVLDIYSNPNNTVIGKRSFGKTKEIVSNHSIELAKGLMDNKVVPTYKHFPGHGDTAVDSHVGLPIINKTYDELKKEELVPFINAINNDAKIIMVGHLALPKITGDNTPATLSKKIVTDILKNDLGYKGLVITDGLNMGALTKNYTDEQIYVGAINAGCDLLLMPNGSKKAIEIIKNNIDEKRIDESVRKILIFKYTYLDEDNTLDESYLGSKEHKDIINQIK